MCLRKFLKGAVKPWTLVVWASLWEGHSSAIRYKCDVGSNSETNSFEASAVLLALWLGPIDRRFNADASMKSRLPCWALSCLIYVAVVDAAKYNRCLAQMCSRFQWNELLFDIYHSIRINGLTKSKTKRQASMNYTQASKALPPNVKHLPNDLTTMRVCVSPINRKHICSQLYDVWTCSTEDSPTGNNCQFPVGISGGMRNSLLASRGSFAFDRSTFISTWRSDNGGWGLGDGSWLRRTGHKSTIK